MSDLHHLSISPGDSPGTETPFAIVLHQRDRTPSGYFRPEATVMIRPALRTSGLLAALPPEDVKSLLFLLTFVTANGWCRPTAPQLAAAMRVGEGKARARMEQLQQFRWQDRPLMTKVRHDNGMDSFVPSPAVVGVEQAAPEPPPAQAPLALTAGREAIIERSRALYAKPRAEVERMIAEQMGWGPPAFADEDPAVAEGKRRAYQRLTDLGMPRDQALDLLARFELGRVERQLDWLPQRRAKSPLRFLLAAVEHDYEAPAVVRLQNDLRQNAKPEPISDANHNENDAVDQPAPEVGEAAGEAPEDERAMV